MIRPLHAVMDNDSLRHVVNHFYLSLETLRTQAEAPDSKISMEKEDLDEVVLALEYAERELAAVLNILEDYA